jgi:hypothetical protein
MVPNFIVSPEISSDRGDPRAWVYRLSLYECGSDKLCDLDHQDRDNSNQATNGPGEELFEASLKMRPVVYIGLKWQDIDWEGERSM